MRRFSPLRVPLRATGLAVVVGGCLLLAGCATVRPPPTSADPVAASLHKLGVNTTATKRKAPTGNDLPGSFAPLGATASFGDAATGTSQKAVSATDQVLLAGPTSQPSNLTTTCTSTTSYPATLFSDSGGSSSALACFAGGSNPWVAPAGDSGVNSLFQSLSSVATGDIDGDGQQELVAAYVAPPASAGADPTLELKIIQDSKAGFATSVTPLMDAKNVTDVSVATGDFTGDGTAGIVIAVAYAGQPGQLLFLSKTNGAYQIDAALTKTLARTLAGSAMSFRLASGNLDYDRADELALVVNEYLPSTNSGVANYYVYDDANHGFQLLKSGVVQGSGSSGTHTAQVADISLGDIDGDGLNEIVMGGPTSFSNNCGSYGQVVTALDDKAHGFQVLGSAYTSGITFASCNSSSVYFTFVKTLDLNGSGRDSIVANQYVYDYSPACSTGLCAQKDSTGAALKVPDSVFFTSADAGAVLSPTHAAVAVGDVTGDGRQNLLMYVQWHNSVAVYGIPAGGAWGPMASIPTASGTTAGALRPHLVTTRSEPSGPVLRYVPGSYKLVFTQPIVVAALAAPPCGANIGQNTSACVTTFGKSTTTGATVSTSVSVTAGVTVGFEEQENVPWVGDYTESETFSMQESATFATSAAYTLTKAVTYSTGSMKDGVVFTTIPFDQYTYKVVSAADPTLVGKLVVVSVPRTPIMLLADRSFYNASVPPGAMKIDSHVFTHKVGDISSYPTFSQVTKIIGEYGGTYYGPKSVSEGSGSTQLSIAVGSQVSSSTSLGIQYTDSFQATGQGYVDGMQVGYGATASLQISSGQTTTYTGTVGNIDSADFAAHQYQFGMFTYAQPLDGQKFDVVNYWVQQ